MANAAFTDSLESAALSGTTNAGHGYPSGRLTTGDFQLDSAMAHPALRILQVNTHDLSGGAEKVSWELFQEYRRRGLASWLAVGRKHSNDPDVFRIPHHLGNINPWSRAWWRVHQCLQPLYQHVPGARFLCRATHALAAPRGIADYWFGQEDFSYPGAKRVLDTSQQQPTILHCHNLHGKYFDLRALVTLSRRVPVFVTLHDAWMFTGHCAHFFECQRWVTGCGNCLALDTYPAIRRDASNFNCDGSEKSITSVSYMSPHRPSGCWIWPNAQS